MSERLPVVPAPSSSPLSASSGWAAVRQRGSHVRLKHPDGSMALVVSLHRELKRRTLAREELRRLL